MLGRVCASLRAAPRVGMRFASTPAKGEPSVMTVPPATGIHVTETPGIAKGEYIIQIARYQPDKKSFRVDSYTYEKGPFMVLDVLIAIKAHQDPTLTFRNSCCEGVCGSCAMNINGANTLACITPVTESTVVYPLPNMPILRDLVVDFRWFFKQIESVKNYAPKPNKELYHIDAIKQRYVEAMRSNREAVAAAH
eukprot:TRINITY_DN7893_c0_g1_i1.p1 TRINITY_DN7893_c0_g1~~TRINITY_DN7893_c0_g1_i1.p1  ORF type:complete len:203 (+),score=39.96 TRINITY_DN7893_c0_g1_i1:29-610(+)